MATAAHTAVTLNLTVFDAMLKEIYPDVRIESLAMRKRPLLEWFDKKDEWYGDAYVVPVMYEDPQGYSEDLDKALTNAEASKQVKFVSTARAHGYQVVKLLAEAVMAASKDVGSFIRAKETQFSGALRNLGKQLHIQLYRGQAAKGQIASLTTADPAVITLTVKSDVYNFGIGETIMADDTATGASPRTLEVKVTKRDAVLGTITVDDDVVSNNSWAANDYLFTDGTPSARCRGLADWIPLSAPSATTFLGVDRTSDLQALSGHRVDNTGRSLIENGEELAMQIGEFGGEPDAWFMNPRAGLQLAEDLGAKVTRTDGGHGRFGFSGFTLEHFVTGPINVIFDTACPANRAYMLQKNTWRFAHMGQVPHLIRDDGRDGLRGSTTDTGEYRWRWFGDLFCEKPGYNGVCSVAVA
jgi:hypothetical protein